MGGLGLACKAAKKGTLVGTATTNWHGVARIGIESVRANIAL